MSDRHDLQRFRAAQESGGTYERALAELRAGRKTSHWIWFIFPQIAGLGNSVMSRHYAIAGLDEARAYLADPVLGPRLEQSAQVLLDLDGRHSAKDIFGGLDAQKLQSSMTLFARAAPPGNPVFAEVLARYFRGKEDKGTTSRL